MYGTKDIETIPDVHEQQSGGPEQTPNRTIDFNDEMYRAVAEKLAAEIKSREYYAGTIELEFEGLLCQLIATVIVYRKTVEMPGGGIDSAIGNIVPIWWEMHTVPSAGREVLNDFSFERLKELLIENKGRESN